MIFDEKSEKVPQIGSSRISVTVNDRLCGQKLKLSIFDDFWRKLVLMILTKNQKITHTGSSRISVSVRLDSSDQN